MYNYLNTLLTSNPDYSLANTIMAARQRQEEHERNRMYDELKHSQQDLACLLETQMVTSETPLRTYAVVMDDVTSTLKSYGIINHPCLEDFIVFIDQEGRLVKAITGHGEVKCP